MLEDVKVILSYQIDKIMKQITFLFLLSLFISCSRSNKQLMLKQYKDSLSQDSLLSAEISKEKEIGTIYQSSSAHHGVVHEFTYLVAMQDFCNKTLLKMRVNGKVDKNLSKELEKELSNAKTKLTSSKFSGLKIELGLYEKFLKQINDQFRNQ